MKKLVFGFACAAAMAVCAADAIESANIVGYQTKTAANRYITGGMCFTTPGTAGATFRLGDLVLKGSTWGDDWINFIDPASSAVDPTKNVTYYSAAEAIADGGSAEDAEWEDISEESKDDVTYPAGTAFLANFLSSGVEVTYAGEVLAGAPTVIAGGAARRYAYVGNMYPGDITMGDIKLVGSTWGDDWVNFIDPTTSAVDPTKNVTYYSAAEAISDGGTAEDAEWEDISEECKDDVPLAAGAGFLCNFLSEEVQIVFPTTVAK